MAQPIAFETPHRDPRKELMARLENAPEEHAAAILDGYEFLQELHDNHVFEVLRGVIGAKEKLLESAVGAAESAEAINAMRNLIVLGKMLGCINPEILQCIAVATSETLGTVKKPVIEPPGLFSLLAQFRHAELRRSIAFINRFLEVLGNQLKVRDNKAAK
jgi:uncharacterized protein YjgD (DUF1641 family)